MNNHKMLWKKSIFKWIQILLCIVPLFVLSLAHTKTDEANFKIFDNEVRDIDSKILESLQKTKKFFAETDQPETAVALGHSVLKPALQQIAGRVSVLRDLLADKRYWEKAFSATIANMTSRATALSNVKEMEASITNIETNIGLMTENHADMENQKTVASIYTEIKNMVNFFANRGSLFKEYPLIGTPPLIELALLIAFFDYIARTLQWEANGPQLSCRMHNILLDYRPRTVYARLEKLSLESPIFAAFAIRSSHIMSGTLSNAMSVQYNQYGYNKTIPATISCAKGCDVSDMWDLLCMQDGFGVDQYSGNLTCVKDYALLLRHRVEQMFPVELLNTLCINAPWPTGYGWLTIKFRDLRAVGKMDDELCDLNDPCDPFVKLFIDDEQQLKTPNITDTCCYNVNVTFTSKKIHKNSVVKIEVWDADEPLTKKIVRGTGLSSRFKEVYGHFPRPDELILREERKIDSFLRKGRIEGPLEDWGNYLDTISFWQDECK